MTLNWSVPENPNDTISVHIPIWTYPQGELWGYVGNATGGRWLWVARVYMGNGLSVERTGNCGRRCDAKRNATTALFWIMGRVTETARQLERMVRP